MTDTEQRIEIAKSCGWHLDATGYWRNKEGIYVVRNNWGHGINSLPDYLNDLNAMHGAWLTLDEERKIQFIRNLFVICGYDLCIIGSEITRQISAVANSTVRQRAKAFLQTFKKWQDSESSNQSEPKGTELPCSD